MNLLDVSISVQISYLVVIANAGMSYTATNLLYDMGTAPPVEDAQVDIRWLKGCSSKFGLKSSSSLQPKECGKQKAPTIVSSTSLAAPSDATPHEDQGADASAFTFAAAPSLTRPGRRGAAVDSASSAYATGFVSNTVITGDDVALTVDCNDGASPFTGNKLAAQQSSQSALPEAHSEVLVMKRSSRVGNDEMPPFLMYRWPKGVRGWCIIFLLIGQAGPCIAILTMLVMGKQTKKAELYLYTSGVSKPAVCTQCMCKHDWIRVISQRSQPLFSGTELTCMTMHWCIVCATLQSHSCLSGACNVI
jgi:hypothetical protein